MAGFGKHTWVGGPFLSIHTDIRIDHWLCDLPLTWIEVVPARGAVARTFGCWSVAGQWEPVPPSGDAVRDGLAPSL